MYAVANLDIKSRGLKFLSFSVSSPSFSFSKNGGGSMEFREVGGLQALDLPKFVPACMHILSDKNRWLKLMIDVVNLHLQVWRAIHQHAKYIWTYITGSVAL